MTTDYTMGNVALHGLYQTYREANAGIANLSFALLAAKTRECFPSARYLTIEETDQDSSGSLTPDEVYDDLLQSLLDDAERADAWTDDQNVCDYFCNLDDSNRSTWEDYTTEVDGTVFLDLSKAPNVGE